MSDHKQITVHIEGGIYTVKDGQRYLDPSELMVTIKGLIETAKQLQNGVSHEALADQGYWNSMQAIAAGATWKFDQLTDGHCVYFCQHPARPGQIKIGYTKSLAGRARSLQSKYTKSPEDRRPVRMYAAAYTPFYRRFERMLLGYFWDSHVEGEWYHDTAVLRWLRNYQGGYNANSAS